MPGDSSYSAHHNVIVQEKDEGTRTRSSSASTTRITNSVSSSSTYNYYGSLWENDHRERRHPNEQYHYSIIEDSDPRSDEYFIPIHIPDDSDCCCSSKASSCSATATRNTSNSSSSSSNNNNNKNKPSSDEEYQNDETTILYVSTSDEKSQSFSKGHDRLLVIIPKSGFLLSKILGFQSNPFVKSESDITGGTTLGGSRNSPMADLRLSMLSTLSTSYNTLSISWAIQIMSKIYPINEGEHSICSTALLAGMIFGQLFGGALGDYIGRHRAMTFVMLTQVLAALASAFCFDRKGLVVLGGGHDDFYDWNCFGYHFNYPENLTIYKMLAVWRFLLGIGCGGAYPLSATLSAESTSCPQDRGKLVALTFSMQGVGYLLVPVYCWVLISFFGEVSDLSWRIMLGSGSIFGMILIALRTNSRRGRQGGTSRSSEAYSSWKEESVGGETGTTSTTATTADTIDSALSKQGEEHSKCITNTPSILEAIKNEKSLARKLIGTAGCWFLFDVLFYGNTLFQPVVLHSVFGSQETLSDTARDSSIMAILALPGYFISIACVGRQSPRFIQLQGFLCMSVLYFTVGYNFESLSKNRTMLLVLYGSTFFFSDYGPNTTTFMLPSMTFSPQCRSTLNGISAACGKVGAVLGASLFEPAAYYFGNKVVLMICSALSIIGAMMTWVGVTPTMEHAVASSSDKSGSRTESTTNISSSNAKHPPSSSDDHNIGPHASNHDMDAQFKFKRKRNRSAPSFLDYDG
mmetsp:Transcript_10337/g.19313  ORF Transcript_10337/g.19313 Transcript_10337/m.19313 type:complete len:747 (-) Transcript_10337:3524-5764(-)